MFYQAAALSILNIACMELCYQSILPLEVGDWDGTVSGIAWDRLATQELSTLLLLLFSGTVALERADRAEQARMVLEDRHSLP